MSVWHSGILVGKRYYVWELRTNHAQNYEGPAGFLYYCYNAFFWQGSVGDTMMARRRLAAKLNAQNNNNYDEGHFVLLLIFIPMTYITILYIMILFFCSPIIKVTYFTLFSKLGSLEALICNQSITWFILLQNSRDFLEIRRDVF